MHFEHQEKIVSDTTKSQTGRQDKDDMTVKADEYC